MQSSIWGARKTRVEIEQMKTHILLLDYWMNVGQYSGIAC